MSAKGLLLLLELLLWGIKKGRHDEVDKLLRPMEEFNLDHDKKMKDAQDQHRRLDKIEDIIKDKEKFKTRDKVK